MHGHVSPRLGWRFEQVKGELKVFGADGRQLRTPDGIAEERDAAEAERVTEAAARRAAETARADAETVRAAAEAARVIAERERDEVAERMARMAAMLRQLGGDPDAV